jgi:hypothetical protein
MLEWPQGPALIYAGKQQDINSVIMVGPLPIFLEGVLLQMLGAAAGLGVAA